MIKLTFTTQGTEAKEVTVFLAPGEHIVYDGGIIRIGGKSYFITDEEYSRMMEKLDQEYTYRFIRQAPPPYFPSPDEDPTEDPMWDKRPPRWGEWPWWKRVTCQCRKGEK